MRETITLRQRKLAKNIKNYANSPVKVNAETLLVDSGYTKISANASAKKLFAQKGLKLALKEEGISLDNADNVVKSILNSPIVYEMVTPDNQLRAADYIAKRIGGYAPEKLEIRKVVANIVFNKPVEGKSE